MHAKRWIVTPSLLLMATLAAGQEEPAKDATGGTGPPAEINVLVLGKTQMLATPGGFPEFCENNTATKRSELRTRVVAELKAIAEKERPALLEAIGDAEQVTHIWLVNAVVARMPLERAKALSRNKAVGGVFNAGVVPEWRSREDDERNLTEVLDVVEREPFTTKGKTIPKNLEALNVPQVWKKLGITGEGALVVSFDNGLDYRHADLRKNVWINPDEVAENGKDDDKNGLVDDLYGWDFTRGAKELIDTGKRQHGTLTSSLVIGDGSGGMITGVAPRARLMAVRATGGPCVAARAFQYALEEGADVVNMSFSILDLKQLRGVWRRMAENATAAGLVLVSGSGNFQLTHEVPVQIRIPEGIPCVICVGGVTPKKKLARKSSNGPVEWERVRAYGDHPMPDGLIKPDLVAFFGPGLALAGPGGKGGYLPRNNGRRGNSLSAPQVTGTIALMLSANPELTPWRVKEILESTARDLVPEGKDTETGAGLLDAFAAVERAIELRRAVTDPDSGSGEGNDQK
jgi:subtilisin family serine protease